MLLYKRYLRKITEEFFSFQLEIFIDSEVRNFNSSNPSSFAIVYFKYYQHYF